MIEKRGLFRKKPLEDIIRQNMVWMPYHRIRYECGYSEKNLFQRCSEIGLGETALNAMLCESVKSETELFMLFRPNYLKRKIINYFPQSEEIVGPTVYLNFQRTLGSLLKSLHEVKDELNRLGSVLYKNHVRIRRYSWILPVMGGLKNERRLSEEVARLRAKKNILNMCLNTNQDIRSIKVTEHDTFYYPTLIVTLKHKENGTERYLIINLAESRLIDKHSSCDKGLTKLCNKNSLCKEIIARSIIQ